MSTFRLKGTSGPVINQAWTLEDRTLIGRSDDCEIRIDGKAVAPRHAAVTVEGGKVVLRLLETGGELHLNGQAVEEAALVSGDEIRIGDCRWLLQAPGLKPEKVLTEQALRRRVNLLPWLVAGTLSALALLAWRLGWLPF